VKSAYSLLEGADPAEGTGGSLAREARCRPVAVTDVNNLFGVYEISEDAGGRRGRAADRRLPSFGRDLDEPTSALATGRAHDARASAHLPVLVQNEIGYRNLAKLLSAAYLGAEPGDWPHVKAAALAAHAEGLIALTGGPGGRSTA
jgi:DNA polymerase-3 subunit alpha